MALYAAIADVEARAPIADIEQALDGAAQGSSEYDAGVTRALTAASALIDSYAGVQYKLPLAGSERLEQLAVDIALYELRKRRGVVSEQERTDYEDALRFLKDLSAGKAKLDQPDGEEAQTAGGGAVLKRDETDYVFRKDTLEGF